MSAGTWVALAAVVVALGFGSYRKLTDGTFRGTKTLPVVEVRGAPAPSLETPATNLLADTPWATRLGTTATLLQFSSAFCAPCRATRRVLVDVTASRPDVAHIEVDAEQHLDLVRRLGVLRTPTTLVLDPAGRELGRAAGAPSRDQVLRSLPDAPR